MTDTPNASGTPAPKKSSLGKIIKRTVLTLFLLVVVGLVVLYLARNSLVRAGVVSGGKYATGQETALEAADLGLLGTLDLSQFQIHNLNGYKEPQFLTMKSCNVIVEPGSLLSNKVVVDSIAISGLEITVEQNGMKNNLADLMNLIKKNSPAASAAPASGKSAAPDSPGKTLQVKSIDLAATKVHLRGLVPMDLDLGAIHLDDITNPDGRPMKIADVMVKVLLHVAQQIVENPKLPGEFKNGLKDVTALMDNLKGDLLKDAKNFKGLQDATKGLQDAGKQIQDLGRDATKGLQGLGGLIPGNKTQPATKP